METKVAVVRNWDDLVFDSRNKDYGAYTLRQAYLRRLFLGFGISTSLIIVLLFLPRLFPGSSVLPVVLPPIKLPGEIKLEHFEIIKPIERPVKQAKPENTSKPNATIKVVSQPVEVTPTVENSQVLSTSSNIGNASEGIIDGETDNATQFIEPVVTSYPVNIAEVMPSYEGGMEAMMKFISKKLRYPFSAQQQGIEGTVYISFVVNGDGHVSDITVMRGIHPDCDREAARVIGLLKRWSGGKQNGNPVAVRMALPIKFSLSR